MKKVIRPKHVCKDCWVEFEETEPKAGWRKLMLAADGSPVPGPRCTTHHRIERKRRRGNAHGKRLENAFEMPAPLYWALYAFQGGKCWGCQWATGATKNLAVDHDHSCDAGHPPERGCPKCWRALLCGPCNQTIGRLGIEALLRLVQVLAGDGPAKQLFVLEEINDDGAFAPGMEDDDGDESIGEGPGTSGDGVHADPGGVVAGEDRPGAGDHAAGGVEVSP